MKITKRTQTFMKHFKLPQHIGGRVLRRTLAVATLAAMLIAPLSAGAQVFSTAFDCAIRFQQDGKYAWIVNSGNFVNPDAGEPNSNRFWFKFNGTANSFTISCVNAQHENNTYYVSNNDAGRVTLVADAANARQFKLITINDDATGQSRTVIATADGTKMIAENNDQTELTLVDNTEANQTAAGVMLCLNLNGGLKIEAENGVRSGTYPNVTPDGDASGGYRVGYLGNGATMTYYVYAQEAGEYNVLVRYNTVGNRKMYIQINDGDQTEEDYAGQGTVWNMSNAATHQTIVTLSKGLNTIVIGATGDAPNVDYLLFSNLWPKDGEVYRIHMLGRNPHCS